MHARARAVAAGDAAVAAERGEAFAEVAQAVAAGGGGGVEAAPVILDGDEQRAVVEAQAQPDFARAGVFHGVVQRLAHGEEKAVPPLRIERQRGQVARHVEPQGEAGGGEKLGGEGREVVRQRGQRVVPRIDVARDLPPLALDAERRHGLFLAVREALHNAVKHSGAREVWLRLRLDAGALLITIEDHGRGFDPAATTGGDGLRNLRERLAALGGDCRIDSIDGAGTRVHLSLPLAGAGPPG